MNVTILHKELPCIPHVSQIPQTLSGGASSHCYPSQQHPFVLHVKTVYFLHNFKILSTF